MINNLPIQDDVIVTIAGTVAGFRGEDFLLQDGTGQIWVEPVTRSWQSLGLQMGDRVTVVGDRDDFEDFDAISITRTSSANLTPIPSNPLGMESDDVIFGDINSNTINGSNSNTFVFAGQGNDIVNGNGGNDTLRGGKQNDIINGGIGDDSLMGDHDQDTVTGEMGNDVLWGGQGNDFLFGGEGNDTLSGDRGVDLLNGGAGNDMFVLSPVEATSDFNNSDRLVDFQVGLDRIQLTGGLSFAALSLDSFGNSTALRVVQTNQIIGIIDNLTPNQLNASSFL